MKYAVLKLYTMYPKFKCRKFWDVVEDRQAEKNNPFCSISEKVAKKRNNKRILFCYLVIVEIYCYTLFCGHVYSCILYTYHVLVIRNIFLKNIER